MIYGTRPKILKKKSKLAKKKENSALDKVLNNFWWSCSTCEENVTLHQEKWTSVLYHISNTHKFSDNTIYKQCTHSVLSERERCTKKWLEVGSPSHNALKSIICDKKLLNDLSYFIKFIQWKSRGVPQRLQKVVVYSRGDGGKNTISGINPQLWNKQKASNEQRYKAQYSKVTSQSVCKKIMEPKRKEYIPEILGEMSTWEVVQKTKKRKSIAKMDIPGKKCIDC